MPWPLLRAELNDVEKYGMTEVRFVDYNDAEEPPIRRFRIEYQRP